MHSCTLVRWYLSGGLLAVRDRVMRAAQQDGALRPYAGQADQRAETEKGCIVSFLPRHVPGPPVRVEVPGGLGTPWEYAGPAVARCTGLSVRSNAGLNNTGHRDRTFPE